MVFARRLQPCTLSTMAHSVLVAMLMTSLVGLVASDDVDLYMLGLFPMEGAWHGGEALMTSAQIAIDLVNNNPDVLPGYRLNLVFNDTKCHAGHGLKALFENLYSPPTKLLILGAACSAVSEATAQTSHLWNLVQLSYASVSAALSVKSRFPKFLRVSAPDIVVNPVKMEIFHAFGWSHIATLHQSLELFSTATDDLIGALKKSNYTLLRSEIFKDDPTLQVQSLKDNDCRIIVGSFYEDKGRKVFCEAYKIGLYGKNAVWILVGWYNPGWWLIPDPNIDCTPDQLAIAVEGYLDAGIVYTDPDGKASISGLTPSSFWVEFRDRTQNRTLFGENMAAQGHDAVWAIALGLNATAAALKEQGDLTRLENFTYTDDALGSLILDKIKAVAFQGLRGYMSFDENGDPVGLVKIDRVQGGKKNTVGFYEPTRQNGQRIRWLPSNPIVWEGGVVPRDVIAVVEVTVSLSRSVYVAFCSLAGLGLLLALSLLAFNVLLRNNKIVKMSSPRLNNMILVGCMLGYLTVFMADATGSINVHVCKTKIFLLTTGLSLTFGALFSKTWRVHVIFTNPTLQKKVVTDTRLFVMVGILVLLNTTVLVAWIVVDPYVVVTNRLPEQRSEDQVTRTYVRMCQSNQQVYFSGALYALHGLLLLLGAFLAWETRKVHIAALNDSKYIGMCIYNAVLLSGLGAVVSMALNLNITLEYAIQSALILAGTTLTQMLIFAPKIASYRQNRLSPGTETEAQTSGLKRSRIATLPQPASVE